MTTDGAGRSTRERAVELRRAGLSRSQIARSLGLGGGGEPLSTWLQGVPVPAWTRRPNAKDDLRERAAAMRQEGRSDREIQEVVGVAKSTLSLWLRDVPLTEEQKRALEQRGPAATRRNAEAVRANAVRRRERVVADAKAQIAEIGARDLFVAGVVAYWAEGAKNKPWRTGEAVKFMNSDPRLICLFLAWLRLVGVSSDRLIFRVHIDKSADAAAAVTFWAGVVGAARAPVRQMHDQNPQSENHPEEHRRELSGLSPGVRPQERRPQPADRGLVPRHCGHR